MNIAVIPARKGSKRIPGKNIKLFNGKPIISWPIEAATKSGIFDLVAVSTDCDITKEISTKYGASLIIERPPSLADDFTPTVDVISHAVESIERTGLSANYICCIYPCTPFVNSSDIKQALDILKKSASDYCYPITEFTHPIQRALSIDESGNINLINPDHELTRTQDLPVYYHDTGQFYWGRANSWRNKVKIHSNACGLILPSWRSVDIDNLNDWKRAESLYMIAPNVQEDGS